MQCSPGKFDDLLLVIKIILSKNELADLIIYIYINNFKTVYNRNFGKTYWLIKFHHQGKAEVYMLVIK